MSSMQKLVSSSCSGFELLTGELKCWKRPTASGGIAACWFCPDCGNRIYHENPKIPEIVRLKPGTLDDTSWLAPGLHVWTQTKQPWTPIPEGVPTVPGNPRKPGGG